MAFGILVLSILSLLPAFFLSLPVGMVLFAVWPGAAEHVHPAATVAAVWFAGLGLILRHYWRVTRSWTGERRGGAMLSLVEIVCAGIGFTGWLLLRDLDDELLIAGRACFAGFQLLLILSHIAAYALLRYRPRSKEIVVWTLSASALATQLSHL